jgi:hypothetical protein
MLLTIKHLNMKKPYMQIALVLLCLSCQEDQATKPNATSSQNVVRLNGTPINEIGDRISLKELEKLTGVTQSSGARTKDGSQPIAVIFGKQTLERLMSIENMQAVFIYKSLSDEQQLIIVPADGTGNLILQQNGLSTSEDRGYICPPTCPSTEGN